METAPLICNIDGLPLAYHQEGCGETILMVHDITTSSFICR